jgi:hypothetical protein
MPDNSSPLTHEEHEELARELRNADARLRELWDLAVSVYGPNHRVSFSFQKVLETLNRLRADLQTQVIREFPGWNGDGPYT